jgi:hypothetical protein
VVDDFTREALAVIATDGKAKPGQKYASTVEILEVLICIRCVSNQANLQHKSFA